MSSNGQFPDSRPTAVDLASVRAHDDIQEILLLVTRLHDGIEERVAAGIVRGVKQLLADPEFMEIASERFTHRVFLAGSKQASQWVGGRILTAIVVAVVGLGIGWLVKTGRI